MVHNGDRKIAQPTGIYDLQNCQDPNTHLEAYTAVENDYA